MLSSDVMMNIIEICMLVVRDVLSAPAMDHNLIPPFSMREAGINVIDDSSVYFPNKNLRKRLKLCCAFSYFLSTNPSIDILNESDQVLSPTHDSP